MVYLQIISQMKGKFFLTRDIEVGVEAGEEEELLRHAVRHGVSGADLVLERLCAGGQCIGDEEYRDY